MGVVHNRIRIDEIEKSGGGSIEERLTHLEDEYTNLVTYKTEEVAIGEWVDGSTIYKKVIYFDQTAHTNPSTWINTNYNLDFIKEFISGMGIDVNNLKLPIIPNVIDNNFACMHFRQQGSAFKGAIIEYIKNEE